MGTDLEGQQGAASRQWGQMGTDLEGRRGRTTGNGFTGEWLFIIISEMNKTVTLLKKEPMLTVALLAAIISFFITPPTTALLHQINWKTLATLFMLLTVLEGFKQENLFLPLLKQTSKISKLVFLTFFFVFSVFFTSMFVTNDVSLIIFVPLTIIMFRAGNKEKYIIPVLTLENIAAIRGSLLTPFGSPQNLFLYSQSGISTLDFLRMMLPLWIMSIILLALFIVLMYCRKLKESLEATENYNGKEWAQDRKSKFLRLLYLGLFILVVTTIVTRTRLWPVITLALALILLICDRKIFLKTDFVLLLTFLCFFTFSSSLCANPAISAFLTKHVANHEYCWSILLSQIISNVPASIVLWPFSVNLKALLYGLDSAGLCSIIGSLASVINLRLFSREYKGQTWRFMWIFEVISMAFFALIMLPQLLLLK